jgi:outer membrane receptor for ferrienterochelin and colicins
MLALLLPLLAVANVSRAHDGAHVDAAAPPLGAAWAFSLPSLDGSRFVTSEAIKGPLLVNFWAKDCAPCVAELPRLEAFAAAHPHWTVWLVSTDAPTEAREFAAQLGLKLPVLRRGAQVSALMKSAGNRHGALPFSVALHDGRLCARQRGELTEAQLLHWSAACGSP